MKYALIAGALLLGGIILWYFLSPLFTTVIVEDAVPEVVPTAVPSGSETLSPEERAAMAEAMAAANATSSEPMSEPMPVRTPVVSLLSEVMGTAGHPAEGTLRVIETADGPVIRFEDFSTINGPQLHLYLAKDLDATEYLDLGPIRGTSGNINYTVPAEVDLSEYQYVMHWCVPFGILFNYAEIPTEE